MLIDNDQMGTMEEKFASLVESATQVRIASGYLGRSTILHFKDRLEEISRDGGLVQIICGLGAFEGINSRTQSVLADLHLNLRTYSRLSGVFFCIERRYHGKMFLLESNKAHLCSIGSSNFSPNGYSDNLEANWLTTDDDVLSSARDYFDRLLDQSRAIDRIDLRQITRLTTPRDAALGTTSVPRDVMMQPIAFSLRIRPQPRSSINLAHGRGRLDRGRDLYIPRPYYEAEITIPVDEWRSPLTDAIPNVLEPHEIRVCGQDGVLIEAKFKRKTSNENDDRSLHQCGGDFMTSPRVALGEFIKGKLITAGLLTYGNPVTNEILEDYGSDLLEFRSLGENIFHIHF